MFREFLPLDPIAKSRRWSPWASARRWAAPPQRLAMWMRSGELSDMVALGPYGTHKKAVVVQIICLFHLVSCMASVVRDSTWLYMVPVSNNSMSFYEVQVIASPRDFGPFVDMNDGQACHDYIQNTINIQNIPESFILGHCESHDVWVGAASTGHESEL